MNNKDCYEISKNHPEEMFDPFYAKQKIVIPQDASTDNLLTANNKKMIDDITAFKVLLDQGYDETSKPIQNIIEEIVKILSTTPNINLSAFSQFFMVHNATHSNFMGLNKSQKFNFVYEMLLKFIEERYDMYHSHGYTNTILQVMCDNYSHKRNSKTSIDKILYILNPYQLKRLINISKAEQQDNWFFLPDKGDKVLFNQFLAHFNLKMESRKIEHNKFPDIVFKHNANYYICELKTMKGNGGGQDKQMVEIANFISFSEESPNFHYLAFLDGDYPNMLFSSSQTKIVNHRNALIQALENNPSNYFVNTAGFIHLAQDIFQN